MFGFGKKARKEKELKRLIEISQKLDYLMDTYKLRPWYDLVQKRGEIMSVNPLSGNKVVWDKAQEIVEIWAQGHCEEYVVRFEDENDGFNERELDQRVKVFKNVWDILSQYHNKAKEYKIVHYLNEDFLWDLNSAKASYLGAKMAQDYLV